MDARRTGATSPCSVGAAIGQQPRQAVKGGGRDTGARRARICSPQAEPLPIDSAASGAVFEALNTDYQRGGCGGLPHNTKGVKCTLGIRREKLKFKMLKNPVFMRFFGVLGTLLYDSKHFTLV